MPIIVLRTNFAASSFLHMDAWLRARLFEEKISHLCKDVILCERINCGNYLFLCGYLYL